MPRRLPAHTNLPSLVTVVRTKERSLTLAQWSYNPATQQLTPQWINPDGCAYLCSVSHRVPLTLYVAAAPSASFTQSTALYFGGDTDAFIHRYPATVIKTVRLLSCSYLCTAS
jgi:hypothetical protein